MEGAFEFSDTLIQPYFREPHCPMPSILVACGKKLLFSIPKSCTEVRLFVFARHMYHVYDTIAVNGVGYVCCACIAADHPYSVPMLTYPERIQDR